MMEPETNQTRQGGRLSDDDESNRRFGDQSDIEINCRQVQRHETAIASSESSYNNRATEAIQRREPANGSIASGRLADFFSPEVFQIVLHNPITAHQLLKFSQSRLCGENMEFLEKVDRYNTLLDELTVTMSDIHRKFISVEAPRQVNLPHKMMQQINAEIKSTTSATLPSMELIFSNSQEHVENILCNDVYPRFVKYQMTMNAARALSGDRSKFQGLGDCFCLTNPGKADNPIVFASDGFVKVTGYARSEIIPRNCRFLQGNYTDGIAVKRLRASIEGKEESVEFLLNYRKNGDPFWNLLYVAPLFNADGEVVFFLGGQINVSTTIHSCSDVLRVLSSSEDPVVEATTQSDAPILPSARIRRLKRRNLFKSFRIARSRKAMELQEAGMEQKLLDQIEKKTLKSQMKMFYTAYSKYLVLSAEGLKIEFYSEGALEMLSQSLLNGAHIVGNSIFKVLSENSPGLSKDFKSRINESLRLGRAISVNVNLWTRYWATKRGDDNFVTHWTPLKDERSKVCFVVLTLSLALDGY